MPNTTARRVIENYLARPEPGYALLVDAPWGSGKTFLIKQVTSCDTDPKRLYVSLYGVDTPEAFDWALVRAMNPWTEGKAAAVAKQASKVVSSVSFFGFRVDPSKVSLTELALKKLPETLVFDDVERCSLSHIQLSGLINRYVEHERKRIILIANSERHNDKDAFDVTREKLIGQTITLRPETEAAIVAAWSKIPAGRGLLELQKRQSLILRTFEEAGHQNLRLLERAMRDASELLDALTPDMLQLVQAVDRLTTTFLALHMAYHGGELTKRDMANRARYEMMFVSSASEDDVAARDKLKSLVDRHPECDIAARNRAVLQSELAQMLIVDGYASPETIRKSLDQTQQFKPAMDRPDWVRLWHWGEESATDLEKVIARIDKRMETQEITNPGEILQIYAARNFLDQFSASPNPKYLARRTFEYILELSKAGKMPAREPSSRDRESYGFNWEIGRISFGGYSFEPNRRDKVIARRLRREMDLAYNNSLPQKVQSLQALLDQDPAEFLAAFAYKPSAVSFHDTPILHHFPVAETASALLKVFDTDRELANALAKKLGERVSEHRRELNDERPWFPQFTAELEREANLLGTLYAAQVRLFIRRHFNKR